MSEVKFDKNRVTGFSDAVFSIAMTLLVLEVVVPSYGTINRTGIWGILAERIPNFIGFIVSFFVTAFYWIDYMKTTKFLTNFNMKVLWINIFLLFFVVLLPFSTAFYVNGINFIGPFVFYSINLSLIALMILLMIYAVAKKEKGETGLSKFYRNREAAKMLNTMIVWILAAGLAFFTITLARGVFILIFIINPLIDRHYKKKIARESVD
tara:strand:- start:11396 stop:12022 length:627 start_codon:yes stop_codon:yes gene_type:complete